MRTEVPRLSDASLRRFYSKINIPSGREDCWLWAAALDTHGYGQIGVDNVSWLAHRLMYALTRAFLPPVVMHTCDNPACVNPLHLQAGDPMKNTRDMIAKGRNAARRGSACPTAKLSEQDVVWTISMLGAMSDREIAEKLGVAVPTVNHIRHNRTWKHLPRGSK